MYYTERRTLDMDCPVQRAGNQWGILTMSMLIHSMLADFIIPNLYFRKEVVDGVPMLSVLDGKQRLSTVFSFIQDGFTLHAKTPCVVYEGTEYAIALKTFSELDEELKAAILGYRFTTYQLESCTDSEIEETFARLNAGTSLSKIQQARPKMGMEMARWCAGLVGSDFFQKSVCLTATQLRREDDFLMLVTAMMLLDNDFKIKTNASAGECLRFAESIKGNYPIDKRDSIESIVRYLSEAFGGTEYKYLTKNNVPAVMCSAKDSIGWGIPPADFLYLVSDFFDNGRTEAYIEASGSGNVKIANVRVRIAELSGYIRENYVEDEADAEADAEELEADAEDKADAVVSEADADGGAAE